MTKSRLRKQSCHLQWGYPDTMMPEAVSEVTEAFGALEALAEFDCIFHEVPLQTGHGCVVSDLLA